MCVQHLLYSNHTSCWDATAILELARLSRARTCSLRSALGSIPSVWCCPPPPFQGESTCVELGINATLTQACVNPACRPGRRKTLNYCATAWHVAVGGPQRLLITVRCCAHSAKNQTLVQRCVRISFNHCISWCRSAYQGKAIFPFPGQTLFSHSVTPSLAFFLAIISGRGIRQTFTREIYKTRDVIEEPYIVFQQLGRLGEEAQPKNPTPWRPVVCAQPGFEPPKKTPRSKTAH